MSRRVGDRKPTRVEDGPRSRFRVNPAIAIAIAGTSLLLVTTLVVGAVFAWPRPHGVNTPKAVIVDQLAITDPNPAFVTDATRELEAAGYDVEYVPPEAVTVDFYRTLPKQGYDLIILRSHSSSVRVRREPVVAGGVVIANSVREAVVGLFTTEPYSTQRYIYEQRQLQLSVSSYPERNIGQSYFGLNPEFIAQATEGRFNNTVIILMGCGGLNSASMAKAFIGKGAGAFISWNSDVSAAHTDRAAEQLLERLIAQRLDPAAAVAQTMAEVGPDPAFGARLLAYP